MRNSLALLAISLLCGCLSGPKIEAIPAVESNSEQLAALDQWLIRGKVALRSETDSGSGRLRWSQNQQQYEIEISGALGIGAARISGDSNSVEVTRGKENWSSTDPQLLIGELVGQPVSIANMQWWVRGLPNPDISTTEEQRDDAGYLTTFSQSGWIIEIGAYQTVESLLLPERVVASKDNDVITLYIQDWGLLL